VDLLNRVTISFDVVLEKGLDQIPRVKVSVENSLPKLSILIDPQEFLPKLSLLKVSYPLSLCLYLSIYLSFSL